jgi:ferredoxin
VACFDCLGVCTKKGISYSMPPVKGKSHAPASETVTEDKVSGDRNDVAAKSPVQVEDRSRRRFLHAAITTAAVTPVVLAKGKAEKILYFGEDLVNFKPDHPISPPGSLSHGHLNSHCSSCHLCISKCPANILKPSFLEYGPGGMMQPVMSFERGFCNYDCTICGEVCPTGAITPLTVEQKRTTQVGHVVFRRKNCIVFRDETSCGACSEHCPTQAISMVPYKDSLTIPKVNRNLCIGCGGCQFICPAHPFLAVVVEGEPEHRQAEAIKRGEQSTIQVDDFGF